MFWKRRKSKGNSEETKEKLRKSEEKYRRLAEHINEVIFEVDKEGLITYISPRISDLAGFKPQDVEGHAFKKFVFEEDLPALMKDFKKNISGEIKPSEYRLITQKGEIVWVYSKSRPIKKEGEVIGIQGVLTDITERKRAEQKLKKMKKRFEDIVKSSSDWIWEIDRDNKYTFVSEGVKDILGYEPQELIGKGFFRFMPEREARRMKKILEEVVSKKAPIDDLENWRLTKNQREICLLTNGVPILDHKGILQGYRGVDKDITHRKEIERMKDELISLASHQLRSPLSGVKWGLLALKEEGKEKFTPQQEKYFKKIDQFNEKMIDLIELLVNVSRIDSNALVLRLEPLNLSVLARKAIKDLKLEFEEKNQTIRTRIEEDLPEVNADYRLTKRVYKNFLSNAHKYTPHGGKILFSVFKKDKQVVSQIKDNGYGIPEEEQDQVFEKFFRAENVVKKEEPEGLGLGLYFVKAVVEMSGGKVGFESKENKGATFWFSLPVIEKT